jgi:hypothetical protein
MGCPFLTGNYMLSCSAYGDVYVPSNYELKEYCRHGAHTSCPLYCSAEAGVSVNGMDGTLIWLKDIA